jgi:hypothetical protein
MRDIDDLRNSTHTYQKGEWYKITPEQEAIIRRLEERGNAINKKFKNDLLITLAIGLTCIIACIICILIL